MRLHRIALLALLASSLTTTLAEAWPAGLQTGAPIRVTAPPLADTALIGTFTSHDDSGLTFKPARGHGHMRVRFAEIARLETDATPSRTVGRSTTTWAVIGGVAGWLWGFAVAGGSTGDAGAGALYGVLWAIPGALLGGLAGGLFGGAAATVTSDIEWVELPRASWAGGIPAPAPRDTAGR